MAERRDILFRFLGDSKDLDKATRGAKKGLQGTEKAAGGATTGIGGLAKAVGGLAAAGAVAKFAGDAIDSFSELNESQNAVNVAFSSNAAAIEEIGESAAENLGLAQSEFNTLAVGFSAFAETIAREGGQQVVPVFDELITRASDFASVNNLDVPDAAAKFKSALAGSSEVLLQYGIDASATAVGLKAVEDGLVDNASELTNNQKQLVRYQIIMEETEKTAGDFAKTSGDLANSQRILDAQVENLQATVGSLLAPAMEEGVSVLSDMVTVLEGVSGGADGAAAASEGFFSTVLKGNPITGPFANALGKLADHFNDLADAEERAREELLESIKPTEGQIKRAEVADEILRRQIQTTDELTGAVDDYSSARARSNSQEREAADPAFALLRTAERAEDAYRDYASAVAEYGVQSDEAAEAALTLATRTSEANGAAATFAAEGGQQSIDALEEMLRAGQVDEEVIRDIIAAIQDLNAQGINPKANVVFPVGSDERHAAANKAAGFHTGGVVPGPRGQPTQITALGGETVSKGSVGGMAAQGSGVQIIIQSGIGDPQAIARQVIDVLRTYEITNGPIPIETRTTGL